jgi:hypothetical protein
MKTTIQINGKPVEIELTEEQVKLIAENAQDITNRVKSFEDACLELNTTPEEVLKRLTDYDDIVYKKLKTICKALNEGWTAKPNGPRFYPVIKWDEKEDRYYSAGSYWDHTSALINVHLTLKSKELSDYVSKQFTSLLGAVFGADTSIKMSGKTEFTDTDTR